MNNYNYKYNIPIFIINKILSYNIHPCAVILKKYIQNKNIQYKEIIKTFEKDLRMGFRIFVRIFSEFRVPKPP